MIKLLWNTQNQIVPKPSDSKYKELSRNHIWGVYHKNNSEKWILEVLNKIKFKKITNENEIDNDDILIVVDSSIENKIEFYNKLKLICSKLFLIHLGDEAGDYDSSLVYNKFNYVWRTFCSNRFFGNNHIKCIPIGYKSGVLNKQKKNV